ncbi:hypothetical protein [Halorientalis sp. IM1011]|uniref:hypothetical protein n=1 Tax=Halorientalis sp. IM1011 TaxID=1932360 RepID=UPI0012FCB162|nr:hypothetical protein [Halorientalis sp. IM1011]
MKPDLGSKDIKFLKAVQEVNARAGYEPGADERPPATTSKIAAAAGLNKNEVNYRFNQRGFDEDGLGYIEVYGARLLENGALSSKSAELTDAGEAALVEILEDGPSNDSGLDGDLDDRLSDLESEIDQLREENKALRDAVQNFEESEMGAWDQEQVEKFDATLNAMIAYQRIFGDVFGIDVSEFRDEDEVSEESVAEVRSHISDTLRSR